MRTLLTSLLLIAGCATGYAPQILHSEAEPSPSGLRIRVVIEEGEGRPFCSLPDAGDETRCSFSWGWLQAGNALSLSDDGWRYLSPRSARSNCSTALWSLGRLATAADVQTCAFLLMKIRFIDLPPDARAPENF